MHEPDLHTQASPNGRRISESIAEHVYAERAEIELNVQRWQLTEQEEAEERTTMLGLKFRVSAENFSEAIDDWTQAKDTVLFVDAINASLNKIRKSLDHAKQGCPHLVEEVRLGINAICFLISRLILCRFDTSDTPEQFENLCFAFARPVDGLCVLLSEWCNAVLLRDAPHIFKKQPPKVSGPAEQIECKMGKVWRDIFDNLSAALELALDGFPKCKRRDKAIEAAELLDDIFPKIWPPGSHHSDGLRTDLPLVANCSKRMEYQGPGMRPEELRFSHWTMCNFIRLAEALVPKLRNTSETRLRLSRLLKSKSIPCTDSLELELSMLTQDESGVGPPIKKKIRTITFEELKGFFATVNSLKSILVSKCNFAATIQLYGSSVEWQRNNLDKLTTLSLSSNLHMLELTCILIFDMRQSCTSPIAECRVIRKEADVQTILSGTYEAAVKPAVGNCHVLRMLNGLKVFRTTPVLMTRLLSNLRDGFRSDSFQAKYLKTPKDKRAQTALTVQSACLPLYGFSDTTSGVNDMRAESHVHLDFSSSVTFKVAVDNLLLLDDPFLALSFLPHGYKIDAQLQKELDDVDIRCTEVITAQHRGLLPSLIEKLVAAHALIARGAFAENRVGVKACEVLCMTLLRDDELGACLLIERSFIKEFSAVARETYIATAWQRRQLALDMVRKPSGYQRVCSAIARAESLGLHEHAAVEMQRVALCSIDAELIDFLDSQLDIDTAEMVSEWESGVRDVDALKVSGATVLHMAAAGGSLRLLCALLAVGACANIRDQWNQTPAHWAAKHEQQLALAALVARPPAQGGCDIDEPDIHGQTPRQLAKYNECEVSVEELQAWWVALASSARNLGNAAFMDDDIWAEFVDRATTVS